MVLIGFSTPRAWNPGSWVIRLFTRSRASHAFLVLEDPLFGLRLVLEAHPAGVRLVTLARFTRANRILALVLPAHPVDAGVPALGAWLGERFDTVGVLGMGWVILRRFLRLRPGRNPFRSTRALFCSEAVVRALKAAGHPGADALGDEEESPADVLEFLRRTGGQVIDARTLNLSPYRNHRRPARKAASSR